VLRDEEITRISLAVANTLRSAREAAELSKNALAQKAGVSVQTVSFVEGGVNSPSISTFLRFSSALEIDPEVMLGEARARA
jgi:transcriptional regulator with XRE-family HTH domain